MEWISSLFLTGYGQRSRTRSFDQHTHKKEFWILTNECENNVKHENEAKGPSANSGSVGAPFNNLGIESRRKFQKTNQWQIDQKTNL